MMYDITPITELDGIFFKRDDLFSISGLSGAKARGADFLINKGVGLGFKKFTTVGHRKSPQIHIVGTLCKERGLTFVGHTPMGELPEAFNGFDIIQHPGGYNNVIAHHCHAFAKTHKYFEIPFGMEDIDVVRLTELQVPELPNCIKRVVIPVGSGVNLCGVLRAFRANKCKIPIIGVVVGKSPIKFLKQYAPFGWQSQVTLIEAGVDYAKAVKETVFCGIDLDPIYEAKCIKFIEKGDLFWIIGRRTF